MFLGKPPFVRVFRSGLPHKTISTAPQTLWSLVSPYLDRMNPPMGRVHEAGERKQAPTRPSALLLGHEIARFRLGLGADTRATCFVV